MIPNELVRDIGTRLQRVEQGRVRHRMGIVSALSPLAVKIGGSDNPFTGVQTLDASLAVNDIVSVLTFGADLIVLGKIPGNNFLRAPAATNYAIAFGTQSFSFVAANFAFATITHGLGRTPQIVLPMVWNTNFSAAWFVDTLTTTQARIACLQAQNTAVTQTVGAVWIAIG